MLTDPKEIEIASLARQKNIADPTRSREHFKKILEDFFSDVALTGHYLDMGPGQYDLGEMIRVLGGVCVGLDNDPAVIKLGHFKGFDTIEMNIQDLIEQPLSSRFDGIFNKFTLNAFWFVSDDARHEALLDAITAMMASGAWGWFGPWNGLPKKVELTPGQIASRLDLQRRLFEGHGFQTLDLTREQSRYYGLQGKVANHVVFYKGLTWKPRDPNLGVREGVRL